MEILEGLLYSESHEWVREDDGEYVIGITHHAQHALGDIVFVELPEVDTELEAEDDFGVVESVKAVSDLYAPVDCTVVAVNDTLEDQPDLVNSSPYKDGWIIRVTLTDPAQLDDLMSAEAYHDFLHKK